MSDYRQNNTDYTDKDRQDAKDRMSDYRQNNPDYTDKDRQDAKVRYHNKMKDPVNKAEEQERDRIRKKNNII